MRTMAMMMRPLALPALFALFSVAAMAQPAIAGEAAKSAENKAQQQSQMSARGDTLKLTRQEADAWKLRPVYSANGENVGKLSAVTLTKEGKIESIKVSTGGSTDVTIPADEFAVEGQRISLDADRGRFEEMAANPQ